MTGFVSVELIKLIQKGAAAQFKDLQVPPRACAAGWDAPGLAARTCVHTVVFPPHQFLMVFAAMLFVVICSSLFICRSACVRAGESGAADADADRPREGAPVGACWMRTHARSLSRTHAQRGHARTNPPPD